MPVESRKAQLEAMQSSKQSDFARDFERDSAGNAKALSNPTTLVRAVAKQSDFARDFERDSAGNDGTRWPHIITLPGTP